MNNHLTLITLGVRDLASMERFYSEVFGWKRVDFESDSTVFYTLNGMLLSLYKREMLAEETGVSFGEDAHHPFTLGHNLPSIEAVDALFVELADRGATILKEPRKVFWGGYSGYVIDPEGNLWEIAHNPYMELDTEGNVQG